MDPPPPPSSLPYSTVLRRIISVDAAVSLRLHSLSLPRPFLKSLEISGDGRVFFPVAISLLLAPLSDHLWLIICDLIVGGVVDLILVGVIKHLVRRPRPVYNKDMFVTFAVDHWSFPSGHSSRVCFVAAFLSLSSAAVVEAITQLRSAHVEFACKLYDLLGFNDGQAADFIVLVACSWAAATSISRVLLGRHFVCDVIAGACLGIIEALIVFHFINYSVLESYFLHVKL